MYSTFLRFPKTPLRSLRGYHAKLMSQQKNISIIRCIISQNTSHYRNYTTETVLQEKPTLITNKEQRSEILEIQLAKMKKHVHFFEALNKDDLVKLLQQIQHAGYVPSTYTLFLIHCCGNIMRFIHPEERMKLTNTVWNTLLNVGTIVDVSHYNALLQVYIENEHDFSPLNFLAEMKQNNVEPNRVTFQRLITQYCNKGDIKGATKILEYMNEKQLPLTPSAFNSLIIGHSYANDLQSAVKMLDVMKQSNIDPSSETYGALLQAYAKNGDIENIRKIIADCQAKNILLTDESFLQTIYELATNNHANHVDEILSHLPKMSRYYIKTSTMIFKLLHKNHDEVAFKLLKTITLEMIRGTGPVPSIFSSFITTCLQKDMPHGKIIEWCDQLYDNNHIYFSHQIALRTCLRTNRFDLACKILHAMKDKGLSIKEQFFWPIFAANAKNLDFKGIQKVMETMIEEFNVTPNFKTLSTYVVPYITGPTRNILSQLTNAKIPKQLTVNALLYHKLSSGNFHTALLIVKSNPTVTFIGGLITPAIQVLDRFNDCSTFVKLVRYINAKHDDNYTLADNITYVEDSPNIPFLDFVALKVSQVLPNFKLQTVTTVYENMKKHGLGITKETAEEIKAYYGNNITPEMITVLDELSAENLIAEPLPVTVIDDVNSLTEQLIDCCDNRNESKAMQLIDEWRKKGNELTPNIYVRVINMYIALNNVDKVKELIDELFTKYSECRLHRRTMLNCVKFFIQTGNYDEALSFLKEKAQKESNPKSKALERDVLAQVALTGNLDFVEQFVSVLQTTSNLSKMEILTPLIKIHLNKDDLQNALNKFEWICKTYRKTPCKFELMSRLIANEDAASLQRVTDACTLVHGEMKSLLDLAITFMECGRQYQAKKILQTPGLLLETHDFVKLAMFYKDRKSEVRLKNLIEISKGIQSIDRTKLYDLLLEYYCAENNWKQGLALWTQAQEENIIPTEEFLSQLANLLQLHDQEIPFTVQNNIDRKCAELPRTTEIIN